MTQSSAGLASMSAREVSEHHDLATPASRGDPRGAVDLEAAVVVAGPGRSAGVQPDAHPERVPLGPGVAGHGAVDLRPLRWLRRRRR